AFCHQATPPVPADGHRAFQPQLRLPRYDVCLSCHAPHDDPAPQGHLNAQLTDVMRKDLLEKEVLRLKHADSVVSRTVVAKDTQPALLPVADNRVMCFTCHNPHPPELIAMSSELDFKTADGRPRPYNLRLDQNQLCLECHSK